MESHSSNISAAVPQSKVEPEERSPYQIAMDKVRALLPETEHAPLRHSINEIMCDLTVSMFNDGYNKATTNYKSNR